MRVLFLDIENAPPVTEFWGKPWDASIQPIMLRNPGYIIGVGWKWQGERTTHFSGGIDVPQEDMLQEVWEQLDAADVVVTYNGDRHDLPHLNREFLIFGLGQPSPYRSVDLYKTIRAKFKFLWGKLEFVTEQLGLGSKVKHEGHVLWQKVMAMDPAAWTRMIRYCKQDVRLTEALHDEILGWITNYPNRALYDDLKPVNNNPVCPRCAEPTTRSGTRRALTYEYPRYVCTNGHWSTGTKSIRPDEPREIAKPL
jgi:DNA polymerase elongation subunit (family B)